MRRPRRVPQTAFRESRTAAASRLSAACVETRQQHDDPDRSDSDSIGYDSHHEQDQAERQHGGSAEVSHTSISPNLHAAVERPLALFPRTLDAEYRFRLRRTRDARSPCRSRTRPNDSCVRSGKASLQAFSPAIASPRECGADSSYTVDRSPSASRIDRRHSPGDTERADGDTARPPSSGRVRRPSGPFLDRVPPPTSRIPRKRMTLTSAGARSVEPISRRCRRSNPSWPDRAAGAEQTECSRSLAPDASLQGSRC